MHFFYISKIKGKSISRSPFNSETHIWKYTQPLKLCFESHKAFFIMGLRPLLLWNIQANIKIWQKQANSWAELQSCFFPDSSSAFRSPYLVLSALSYHIYWMLCVRQKWIFFSSACFKPLFCDLCLRRPLFLRDSSRQTTAWAYDGERCSK